MRGLITLGLLLLLSACGNKGDLPNGIRSKEKMETVLWDVIRADEMVSLQYASDSTINKFAKSTELYQQIFRLHGTNQQEFKKSFKYYQTRPELLKPVFDSLQKKGSTVPFYGTPPVKQ